MYVANMRPTSLTEQRIAASLSVSMEPSETFSHVVDERGLGISKTVERLKTHLSEKFLMLKKCKI